MPPLPNLTGKEFIKILIKMGFEEVRVDFPKFSTVEKSGNKISLDVSDLANGIYFLKITQGEKQETVKFIRR